MSKQVAIASASTSAARRLQMMMFGTVLALLAAFSLSAWAQPAPAASSNERGPGMAWPRGGEHGPGMQGMHERMEGMHHGMGGMHGGMGGGSMMFGGSPERMGRMIDHMLDGLNASDAQRAQIKQIMAQASADLKGQAQAARELRQRSMQVLTAPAVDANAAEQIRLQSMALHDQMSRRMTQAMVAAASVLTPEQRAAIAKRLQDRQARMEERMKKHEQDGVRR